MEERSCGVLLPVFSLPSPYGIGTFGRAACRWVDFLRQAGQRVWQVLPLGPTGYGDSPYQSFSVFAGNPYFIDLELLIGEGLLTGEECRACAWGTDPGRVDYLALFQQREKLLRLAFSRYRDNGEMEAFWAEQDFWLSDYALYMSVKARMGLLPWTQWEEDIRLRRPRAVNRWIARCREDIEYHVFVQFLFRRQWLALKAYANGQGVSLLGDLPIYAAPDSADVWANRALFQLDETGQPIQVAGCPPDGFTADGQVWGNPLYRWDVMAEDGYRWWMSRLEGALTLYDRVRLDHFRGLEQYFAIPWGHETAREGRWMPGPGMDLLGRVNRRFGAERIIAEDLGFLTPEVHALREESGYPGMKLLQFAFDSREESDYLPHNYPRHCVVYTGTHDNDTVAGWQHTALPQDVALAREYLHAEGENLAPAFVRAALASVAELTVIPFQDWLGLGSEARINAPSTLGGNWCWRMGEGDASPELAGRMARLTRLYGR